MQSQLVLHRLFLVLSGAFALTASAAFLLFPVSLTMPLRIAVATTGCGLLAAAAVTGWRAAAAERQAVCHFSKTLEQLISGDSLSGSVPDVGAAIEATGAWSPVCQSLYDGVLASHEQLQDARQQRVGLELRIRRLKEQLARTEEVLDRVAEAIVAIDPYDELLHINASMRRLAAPDSDGQGRITTEQLSRCGTLWPQLKETVRRDATSQRTTEIEIPDASGQPRMYRVSFTALPLAGDAGGHGALAVLNDISNEVAIHKRNAEFVSAVSHEMKTPLAGIKAYVELLADDDELEEGMRTEFLQTIDSQADRLRRLVENLLNLARIEAGVVKVGKQPRSINEVLVETLDVVQPRADQKQIELVNDLSPLYLGVLVDRDMMSQAAINLLSNAVKYTPEGGRVTLRSRLEDEEVVFEVQDTGVGLSEEDCARVFDKFYRVQGKQSEMAAGTGLGLALTKHIVEDVHNGELTLSSQVGKGSTFRIALPLQAQAANKSYGEAVEVG